MSPEQRRAALYVRISDDRRDGAGVARQEQDCRALADANGWEVSGVYSDNSRSAYQGKRRPEFDRMCRDIEAGVVDIVLAWHPDRLTRHPIEFEALVTMIERTGVEVRTVTTGQFDLATASGRMHARNLGTIARYESEHRAERVARASKERAEAGKPHGGTRPFGYRPGGADLDPAEAPVVAELFERFLSGHSLRSLVRELNDREIRSVTGKPWAAITIKGILSNPRYASLRVHKGEVIGQGTWEPIVTPEISEAARAILADPSRSTGHGGNVPRYLGSYLYRCGVCDEPMYASDRQSYRCRRHVSVSRKFVDPYVEGLLVGRLAQADAARVFQPREANTGHLVAQESALRERANEAARMFADGLITGAQLTEITRTITTQREELAAQMAASAGSPVARVIGPDIAQRWPSLALDIRREVLSTLLTVRIDRSPTTGRAPFDPARVRIDWR